MLESDAGIPDDVEFIGGKQFNFRPEFTIGLGYRLHYGDGMFYGDMDWDDLVVLDIGDVGLSASSYFSFSGQLSQQLELLHAEADWNNSIGVELPSIEAVLAQAAILQVTLAANLSLEGSLNLHAELEPEEVNGFEVSNASITPGLGIALEVALSVRTFPPIMGAVGQITPTLLLEYLIEYTSEEGTTGDLYYSVDLPVVVYGYIGPWQTEFWSGSVGYWSNFPSDYILSENLQNLLEEVDYTLPEILSMPALTASHNGNAMVVFQANTLPGESSPDPRVQYSIWDGMDWSDPENLLESDPGVTNLTAQYLSNDDALAVWSAPDMQDYLNQEQTLENFYGLMDSLEIYASLYQGGDWAEPIQLTQNTTGDGSMSIAALPDSAAVLVFVHQNTPGIENAMDTDLYYVLYSQGEWTEAASVETAFGTVLTPKVASLGDETVIAVWMYDEDRDIESPESNDTELRWSLYEDGEWTESDVVPNTAGTDLADLDVASMPDDRFIASWNVTEVEDDTTYWKIMTQIYDPENGQWSDLHTVVSRYQEIAEPIVQATSVDGQDIIQVIWKQFADRDTDFYTSTYNVQVGNWMPPVAIIEDDYNSMMATAVIDANNNALVMNMGWDLADTLETGDSFLFEDIRFEARGLDSQGGLGEMNYGVRSIAPDYELDEDAIRFFIGGRETDLYADAGDAVEVRATIRNAGAVTGSATTARFYIGHPDSSDSQVLSTVNVPALDPDQSHVAAHAYTAEAGQQELYVRVDPEEQIEDGLRFNNTDDRTLFVVPNLVMDSLWVDLSDYNESGLVAFNADVRNAGDTPAGFSVVRFYEGHPDSADPALLTQASLPNLGAQSSTTIAADWEASPGLLHVFARAFHVHGETDSTDNTFTSTCRVLPDVEVMHEDITASAIHPDGTVILTCSVRNAGFHNSDSFRVELWHGDPLQGGMLLTTEERSGLAVGDETQVEYAWQNQQPGLETIYAKIRPNQPFDEVEYTNNRAQRSLVLSTVRDLMIEEQDIAVTPADGEIGEALSIEITVHNNGSDEAFLVPFHAWIEFPGGSTDDLETTTIDLLEAGESVSFSYSVETDGWSFGEHTVHAEVNGDQSVFEADYTNNTAAWERIFSHIPSGFSLLTPENLAYVPDDTVTLDWSAATDSDIGAGDSLVYLLEWGLSADFYDADSFYIEETSFTITDLDMTIDNLIRDFRHGTPDDPRGITPFQERGQGDKTDPANDRTVFDSTGYDELPDNIALYWRVRVFDSSGFETWSNAGGEGWSFNISIPEAPTSFALRSPQDGAVLDTHTPTLTWDESSDPDPDNTIDYVVWVSSDSEFNDADSASTTDTTIVWTELPDDQSYWWKVRAQDDNTAGTWSDGMRSFSLNHREPPNTFTLAYPIDGGMITEDNVTLQWNPATDPDPDDSVIYEVEWSLSEMFETTLSNTTSDTFLFIEEVESTLAGLRQKGGGQELIRENVAFTPAPGNEKNSGGGLIPLQNGMDELPDDQTIYWRVKAVD
ncbi:hypothetical protein GF324_10195 [bacterium]|nr:hypothetical protein [bacterium]